MLPNQEKIDLFFWCSHNSLAVAPSVWMPYMWPTSDTPRYSKFESSSGDSSIASTIGTWAFEILAKSHQVKQLPSSLD
jgi:hypothetical protein